MEASERMLRSEASSTQVPSLDVDGLAQVLEVSPTRLREQLVLMEIEGLVEPRAPTFGHNLPQGALRITRNGLSALRTLRPSEIGNVVSASEYQTVVFTDIVGSTEVLSRLGDDARKGSVPGRGAFD